MNKKHVLKASFTEYIHYYKRLKLGLQKACFFLKDFELAVEKFSQKQITEHRYYNFDTKKEFFFSQENVLEVRKILENLALEYYIMKPELLKLEEYDDFERFIFSAMNCFDLENFSSLDFILSFRSEQEEKKLDILARIFILIEKNFIFSFEENLKMFGYYIIDFCIIRAKLSEQSKKIVCDRFYLNSFDDLMKKTNLYIDIARPIIEHLVIVDPERFFFKNNKFEKKFHRIDAIDFSKNIKLPKAFSLNNKNNYYIDLEKFFFFLQDLDDYRIRLNVKKLNLRVLKLKYLDQFEQMCIRFRHPEAYQKVKWYSCDFLAKKLIPISNLNLDENDRFSIYFWEILYMIKKIHLARLNLHNQIFSYYVMSCFSSYEYYNDDIFFSISKNRGFKFLKKRRWNR